MNADLQRLGLPFPTQPGQVGGHEGEEVSHISRSMIKTDAIVQVLERLSNLAQAQKTAQSRLEIELALNGSVASATAVPIVMQATMVSASTRRSQDTTRQEHFSNMSSDLQGMSKSLLDWTLANHNTTAT